ncbi:MAG: hypothetical protein O3B64_02535 [bacterium]|nr:hypothetical protein [bacterium]
MPIARGHVLLQPYEIFPPAKLAAGAFLLGIVFDTLFYKTHRLGLSVLLMQIAFLGVTLTFAHQHNIEKRNRLWISTMFSVLFALSFVI